MSKDKKFVIAIGGTGMRCLESFVHLCAIGMFDNEEIEILTLDTDNGNGNKARVEHLIDCYCRIKSNATDKIDGGTPNVNTFFSAKLNLHRFFTDYSKAERSTYADLSKLSSGNPEVAKDNQDLSDLFIDKETVQKFKLDHGYRAQTHLGSYLMYHSIVEAARDRKEGKDTAPVVGLSNFLELLLQAGENARVFIFGSVFGGTGASSIPIIPVALNDAIKMRDSHSELSAKVKFGSTLLTEYFTFKKPDNQELNNEKVIAQSDFFSLNSQAALQFYQGDPTVQKYYRRLYHVGWPLRSSLLDPEGGKLTKTGGAQQKNDCHVVELMSACAAYDFFTLKDEDLDNQKAEYLYRSAQFDGANFSFDGADFMGEKGDLFTNKLGAFFSFAHIVLAKNHAASGDKGTKGFITQLNQNKIPDYNDIKDEQTVDIDNYMRLFGYEIQDNRLRRGWIYQVYNSVTPGRFIFKPTAFEDVNLNKIDPGDLFIDEKHQWDKNIFHDRYDTFVTGLVKSGSTPDPDRQNVSTTKERFLAHIYNGITKAQKFEL